MNEYNGNNQINNESVTMQDLPEQKELNRMNTNMNGQLEPKKEEQEEEKKGNTLVKVLILIIIILLLLNACSVYHFKKEIKKIEDTCEATCNSKYNVPGGADKDIQSPDGCRNPDKDGNGNGSDDGSNKDDDDDNNNDNNPDGDGNSGGNKNPDGDGNSGGNNNPDGDGNSGGNKNPDGDGNSGGNNNPDGNKNPNGGGNSGGNNKPQVDNRVFKVRFANPRIKNGSTPNGQINITEGATALSFSSELKIPGDYFTFYVDVVNTGEVNARISGAPLKSSLTPDQRRYLSYEVRYADGSEIRENDTLAIGETKTLEFRIEFMRDITVDDLPKQDELINFTYELTYVER